MTSRELAVVEADLLAVAEAMPCPCCGSSAPRCRVWAGGPGHTLGMHESRILAAREARRQPLTDGSPDPVHPAAPQSATELIASTQSSHHLLRGAAA